jgi:hypothetical protein
MSPHQRASRPVGHRGAVAPTAVPALKAGLAHQPGDPGPSALVTALLEHGVDARDSVASPGVRMDLGDLRGQLGVADGAGTGLAVAAGVEGATGDLAGHVEAVVLPCLSA